MFNDRSTPLSLLATRRSGKARDMAEPGPTPGQLERLLTVAARVPDHGKLAPWRFVTIAADRREALADVLEAAYRAEAGDPGRVALAAVREFATGAPCLVVLMAKPLQLSKIPVREQELSVGAACGMLCAAASAMGFVANWLTGWAACSPGVAAALCEPGESIAGFFFIGTPTRELEERPRPDLTTVVRAWEG